MWIALTMILGSKLALILWGLRSKDQSTRQVCLGFLIMFAMIAGCWALAAVGTPVWVVVTLTTLAVLSGLLATLGAGPYNAVKVGATPISGDHH